MSVSRVLCVATTKANSTTGVLSIQLEAFDNFLQYCSAWRFWASISCLFLLAVRRNALDDALVRWLLSCAGWLLALGWDVLLAVVVAAGTDAVDPHGRGRAHGGDSCVAVFALRMGTLYCVYVTVDCALGAHLGSLFALCLGNRTRSEFYISCRTKHTAKSQFTLVL